MSDTEKGVKIKIEGDAASLVAASGQGADALQKLKATTEDLGGETKKLTGEQEAGNAEMGVIVVTQKEVAEATGKTTEAVEESGKVSSNARLQHMALHQAFTQLDKIAPGLGNTLNMVTRGIHGMGDESVGTQAKMAALIDTIGPLIVVMLTIEVATQAWDRYQEKVKAVAAEQAALAEQTSKNLKKMLSDIEALDKAMHPKEKTTAQKDEAELKKTKQGIEDDSEETLARGKFREEKMLGQAVTPEAKAKIKADFEQWTKELNEWKLGQLAAADQAMVEKMNKQTADLKAKAVAADSGPEERAARAQATGMDDFSKGTQEQINGLKERALYGNGPESLAAIAALPDREKLLKDYQADGVKKLQKITDASEKIKTEGTEIGDAREGVSAGADESGHKATQAVRLDEIGEGRDPDTIARGAAGIDINAHGEKLSQEQIKANAALSALFAAHTGGIGDMQRIISDHLSHSTTQAQFTKELAARLKTLEAHSKQTAQQVSAMHTSFY